MDSIFVRASKLCWKTAYAHNCMSNIRLALMEIRSIIAMFVWHFDVEFVEPDQAEPYYKDGLAALRGSLPLRIRPAVNI